MPLTVKDKNYVYPAKPRYISPDSPLFAKLNNDPGYVAELKKNGWRCMVRVTSDGEIILWTRHKTVITDELPDLREQLEKQKFPLDSIFDGELMEHRGKVRQQWNAFGVIRAGSKWLSTLPYKEIIALTKDLVKKDKNIVVVKQVVRNKKGLYNKAEKSFLQLLDKGVQSIDEGIVIKSLSSPVPFGWNNSPDHKSWFKVKPFLLCDGNSK